MPNIITNNVKKIKTYFYEKRLARLEGDLQVLNKRISFNPLNAVKLDNELNSSLKFTKRIEEYRVWYIGNELLLREFYREHYKEAFLSYFWYSMPINYRKIHSGIPSLISKSMSTVLFGSGFDINLSVYNQDKSTNEELSTKTKDLLIGLTDALKVKQKFQEAAELESWSGSLFFKLSHDISLSNFPILEIASIKQAEVIKDRGITKAIVFKYYYEIKDKKYRLDEIYTQNKDKDATIYYQLYKMETKGDEALVDLYSIPQTQEMFLDENGISILNNDDAIVYKGLKSMLAFYKPNKLPSHDFESLSIGASDYEGSIGSFDALDEVYSEMISEVRNNKTIRNYPQTMIPKQIDENGKILTFAPDSFITNYVKVDSDQDQNAKNEISVTHIDDKQESLKNKFITILTTVINNAGLSPFALGITGLESISASSESQQERNKVTLQTRAAKHEIWKPFIEELFIAILSMNYWLRSNLKVEQPFENINVSYDNIDIDIEFNEYIYPRVSELINTWSAAKTSGVASTREAVKKIHPDWDDERIEDEVNLIRYEQGMSLDTPDLMQFGVEEDTKTIEEVIEGTNE